MISRDQEIALVSDSYSRVLALVRVTINSCRGDGPSQQSSYQGRCQSCLLIWEYCSAVRLIVVTGLFFSPAIPGEGGGGERRGEATAESQKRQGCL